MKLIKISKFVMKKPQSYEGNYLQKLLLKRIFNTIIMIVIIMMMIIITALELMMNMSKNKV